MPHDVMCFRMQLQPGRYYIYRDSGRMFSNLLGMIDRRKTQ